MKVAGIGAGPSNLSLASLLYSTELSNIFYEKKASFAWHEGMQVPHASLQVSFLKDLVTLVDPTNPFSFLAFLHHQGRLGHFLNARFSAVSRREFSLYLAWAAQRNPNVRFDEEVLEVDFDGDFILRTRNSVTRSENLVIGVGMQPDLPSCAKARRCATMFHSSEYMRHVRDLARKRIVVVGGGQSGAEVVLDLISREEPAAPAQVYWVSRRVSFWPIDDSAFTNDLFMPCHQIYFAELDESLRHRFLRDHVLASDGISNETLQRIYQTIYTKRFLDGLPDAVSLMPNRDLFDVAADRAGWLLALRHKDYGAMESLTADVVILATGYRNDPLAFMQPLSHRLETAAEELRLDEAFAVHWDGPQDRSIFVQNAARQQKGLADPNLSLLAWRSERILERLTGIARATPAPSVVAWAPKLSELQLRSA